MKKVLIGLLALICILLIGFLGYKLLTQEGEKQTSASLPMNKEELTLLPTPKDQLDIYENLANALAMNKNSVAWIEVPETDINNIVMQSDDNDYYLRRNEDGNDDIYGCYYADYECALGNYDEFSQNTVIYGHSDSTDNIDGKRFAQLHRFNDDEFAKKVPYVYVSTSEGRFKFEIFSVFYTKTDFIYNKVNIEEKEKLEIAKKAKSLSIRNYGIEPKTEDKLLTLSTCTVKYGEEEDYRFVVMAKLCPPEKNN